MGKRKDHRQIWAGDCETDPFKNARLPKPFVWGLYTGTSFYYFWTVEEFVEFIKDQDVIVYFHNGGKFDFHFLLQHINLEEEIKVINGRLVIAHIGKCEIRDSWNILPVALESFGTKEVIDYGKMEAEVRDKHMKEILHYLRADCATLYNAVTRFEEKYGRHLTMAGASMAQWKAISGLKSPKSNKAFFENFSKYYYGGRVQVFKAGHIKGPLKVFDIRSAYPWAMLSEHPYAPEYVSIHFPKKVEPQDMVTVRCVSAGALPWRNDRGSILFPDDQERREYYVGGHEYLAAMETGSLSQAQVMHVYRFTQKQDFSVYINHFYSERAAARKADDVAMTIFTKLFMNSLYGKFCANPENYGNFMCTSWADMNKYKEEGYLFDGMIGPHALLRAPLDPWQEHYINVATGASITSQVRAHLWRAIHASDDPIYCDTDSLICRNANLPIGEDLGMWNFEGEADDAWIAAKKLYWLEGRFDKGAINKSASKGVNLKMSDIVQVATGREIKGGEAIKLAAQGELVEFRNHAPTYSVMKAPTFQKRRIQAIKYT